MPSFCFPNKEQDDFDDEDEDLVRDHVEEAKAKVAVKRLNSGGVGSSVGSGDRRSIGSGKSFGSHRDSARNLGVTSDQRTSSRAGSLKSDASSVGSGGGTNRQQQHRKSGVGGRSTPNGVLSTRDIENNAKSVNNNNNKRSNKDWNSSSIKSNASDESDSLRNEPTPILSL